MSVTWKLDPAHSEIQFRVKHLMITTVTGYFRKFDAEAITETDDFNSLRSVTFTADINSIDTNSEQRDTHLKSADFFSGDQYPQIQFVSTGFDSIDSNATLKGDLTIRGISKPVRLNVDLGGVVVDPYGQTKAGFTVTGKINRKDFGLTWSAVTEAGSVVVSDEIRIHGEIQLIKQA